MRKKVSGSVLSFVIVTLPSLPFTVRTELVRRSFIFLLILLGSVVRTSSPPIW
jgi:hypothetical protein